MITNSVGANTKAYTTDSLTIHYYPGDKSSQYTMYDDDGNNKQAIALKLFELINFNAKPSAQKLRFNISSNGGTFMGKPSKRNIKMIINGPLNFTKRVYINGKLSTGMLPVMNAYGTASGSYYFTFDFSGKPLSIEIR